VDDELIWSDDAETLTEKYGKKQVPQSFTFIAAKLEDNPALVEEDPAYEGKLMALPYVDRMQLLHGNWNVRPSSGLYFKRSWFDTVEVAPASPVVRVRAWDLAATKVSSSNPDPDWTVGLRMSRDRDGMIYIEHMEILRGSPMEVERAVQNMANSDGRRYTVALYQDPAQAGKAQRSTFTRLLLGYTLFFQPTTKDKISFAKPLSSQAEAGNVKMVRGPWNERFLSQMEAFPPEPPGHDDIPDAASLGFIVCANSNLARMKALAKWKSG
jgi:predicted phage terminase large subunit-like protein